MPRRPNLFALSMLAAAFAAGAGLAAILAVAAAAVWHYHLQ